MSWKKRKDPNAKPDALTPMRIGFIPPGGVEKLLLQVELDGTVTYGTPFDATALRAMSIVENPAESLLRFVMVLTNEVLKLKQELDALKGNRN